MMFSEALAIATVANMTQKHELGAKFTRRANQIQAWYLKHLWSDESQWFGVYKQGLEFTGMGGCTQNSLQNKSDPTCCCVAPGQNKGHYANFSVCPTTKLPPSPGNATQCKKEALTPDGRSSSWQCGKAVTVRELLGLGPPFYFGIVPGEATGTKFDTMWSALFDSKEGFWGDFGPTTVERASTCFNKSQDLEASSASPLLVLTLVLTLVLIQCES